VASFVPLKDVSIQDITVIRNNLSFPALVEPFQKNGVSGKAISRMKSHQNIINIGNGRIEEFVAETFFEDFVVEWKSTGLVPKGLLQDISPTGLSLKVCMYRNYIGFYSRFNCSAYNLYH
jgi:hypothetical protein